MQLRNVSKRLLGAAVMLLLPLQATAQAGKESTEEPIREYDANALFEQGPSEPDWIPSLRLGLGVNHQSVNSNVRTLPFTDRFGAPERSGNPGQLHEEGIARGPFNPRRPTQLPPLSFLGPLDGNNPVDGPSVSGGFEIMGPSIEGMLGKPRPFFVFDYRNQLRGPIATVREQTRFDNNRPIPCDFDPPCIDEDPNNKHITANGSVDQEFWILAGMGAAFQLPIEGYNVKLKPSLNYFYTRSVVQTVLTQGLRSDPKADPLQRSVTAEESVANHGIAPRIELDAEIYREGPLSIGFFLAVDFMLILSGPLEHRVDLSSCYVQAQAFEESNLLALAESNNPRAACARLSDPNDPLYQSSGALSYTLQRDRLTYQGTAGLRFSWMGGP